MEENNVKVYIKTDEKNNIIEINSEIFIENTDEYIYLDSGIGDKYVHAQNNYFNKALTNAHGIHNYKFVNEQAIERTEEEKQQELDSLPPATLTEKERIEKLETELTNTQLALTEIYESMGV